MGNAPGGCSFAFAFAPDAIKLQVQQSCSKSLKISGKLRLHAYFDNHPAFVMRMLHSGNTLI
jgi:hypothetical protein